MTTRMASLLLVSFTGLAGQPVLVTDFKGAWNPVTNNSRAQGVLPARWSDNSNWADVWTEYAKEEEDGLTFLRTRVTRMDNGWGQIMHALPRITEAGYYRLSVRVRCAEELAMGMGVRRTASPYNFLWQSNVFLRDRWQDLTFHARITPADYDIGFFILLNGAGVFDIAAFRFEKVTEDELLSVGTPAVPPLGKNLLRNTRFPLGMQSGWSLDRDSSDDDEVTVDTDPEVTGPSGVGGLRIRSPKTTRLYTEPFGLTARQAYTGSGWFRGNGSWRLAAVTDGRVLAQRNFAVSDKWERVSVTFTIPVLAMATALRLEGLGELWLDAMQVEQGAAATGYTGGGPCEVALSAESSIRTHFDDEPSVVRYAATGDRCQVLQARVANLYGDEARLEPVALADSMQGSLDYAVFPARPYGAFRVEVWTEDGQGIRTSPYNETVVFRLRRPHYWMRDAPNSPFGTHTNPSKRHILMAKAAGVNWTRLHDAGLQYIGWYHLERKKGEWTFYDTEINRYRRYGLKILGELGTAPEWATYFDKARNGYFDRFYQPKDLNDYANYVRTVTKRYLGVIDAWDVWNEPWNAGWWAVSYDEANQRYVTSENPQADFARLQKVAFDAARSVDSSLTVLGVNSTTGGSGTSWTRGVVSSGGLESCDAACYHQYTNETLAHPGDTVERGWNAAWGPALAEGKVPKPIWMTEGSPVNGEGVLGAGFYRHTIPFEDIENHTHTSDRLARYLVSHLAQGNRKIFLYSIHAHTHFSETQSPWRVLVDAGGYLHPNAAAHSAAAFLLEDMRFVKRITPAENVTVYLFEGRGRAVAAVAPRRGEAIRWTPPAGQGIEAFDLYGNPLEAGAAPGQTVVYLTAAGTSADLEARLSAE